MIGRFILLREDDRGLDLPSVSVLGHMPEKGHELEWEGRIYRVRRIRHIEDPDARTSGPHRYSVPMVWCYFISNAINDDSDDAAIIPFAPPVPTGDETLSSDVLPPSLVAVLVLAGYDTIKCQVRFAMRNPGQLVHVRGARSFIVPSSRTLNKLAKHRRNQVIAFIADHFDGQVELPFVDDEESTPTSLPSTPAPTAPPPRPWLRLVTDKADL